MSDNERGEAGIVIGGSGEMFGEIVNGGDDLMTQGSALLRETDRAVLECLIEVSLIRSVVCK